MNRFHENTVLTFAVAALAIGGTVLSSASKTDAATSTLKTVTTSDKTASVGLPDGWKLMKGANGFVYVTSPNDDRINLGALVVAKNAPAGTSVGGDVRFALPFSASLKDKFTMIYQLGAAQDGGPVPQLTFAGQSPTRLPMCARLLGDSSDGGQSGSSRRLCARCTPTISGFTRTSSLWRTFRRTACRKTAPSSRRSSKVIA